MATLGPNYLARAQGEIPMYYSFSPKPDITAYELALVMTAAHDMRLSGSAYEKLTDEAKRHYISVPADE